MVGELIRARRRARRLSQEALAGLTGIPQTYISRIERGEVGLPQRATREKFHAALGTSEREWLDAFGEFAVGDDEAAPDPPAVPPPPAEDAPFAAIERWVLAIPGEAYRAELREQREQSTDAEWELFIRDIHRAMVASLDLGLNHRRRR